MSVVFHFSSKMYLSTSVAQLAPIVLEHLQLDKVSTVQFLRNGRVRIMLKCVEYKDMLPEQSTLMFGDVTVPITASDAVIRSVYVRDLPFEVHDEDVEDMFRPFGVVHSVRPCYYRDFPSVANGSRVLLISFDKSVQSIPSSLTVFGFPVCVWYAGQPVICPICRESGHSPQACPFAGRCLHCKQPGHRARDCKQAWGPSAPHVPVSTSASATQSPMPVPPPVSQSSVSTACAGPPVSQLSFSFSAPVSLPVPVLSANVSVSVPVSAIQSPVPSPPPVSQLSAQPVSPPVSQPLFSFSAPVPVSSVIVSTPLSVTEPVAESLADVEEGEIVSEPPATRTVPPVPTTDLKELTNLVFAVIKPGSDQSTVLALAKSLMSSHKLSVSNVDLRTMVESFCSS